MPRPVLDVYRSDFSQTALDVFGGGGFDSAKTDTGHFTLIHGGNRIDFVGSFDPVSGGAVAENGTITGFKIYQGDTLLGSLSGLSLSVADLANAMEDLSDNDDGSGIGEIMAGRALEINVFGDGNEVYGTAFADIMRGHGGADYMAGADGNDKLYGGAGKDRFTGGDGDDHVFGGKGSDVLNGSGGLDTLTGGNGKDKFVFSTEVLAGNRDKVTDFQTGIDKLILGVGIFGFDAPGPLANSAFHVGASAHDGSDRIIYNAENGALYVDSDGKGGVAQVKFAVLDAHLDLKASDFYIDTLF